MTAALFFLLPRSRTETNATTKRVAKVGACSCVARQTEASPIRWCVFTAEYERDGVVKGHLARVVRRPAPTRADVAVLLDVSLHESALLAPTLATARSSRRHATSLSPGTPAG
jgi:hypothetical protein